MAKSKTKAKATEETTEKKGTNLKNGKAELIKDLSYNRKKGDKIDVSESTYQALFKKGYVK